MQRDVQRARDMPVVVLATLTDVEDGWVVRADDVREVGEVRDAAGPHGGALGQGANVADGGPGEIVDADADEFPSSVGDLVLVVRYEGQWGAPGVEPAEVGDEGARQFEAQRAAKMPGGECGAV